MGPVQLPMPCLTFEDSTAFVFHEKALSGNINDVDSVPIDLAT